MQRREALESRDVDLPRHRPLLASREGTRPAAMVWRWSLPPEGYMYETVLVPLDGSTFSEHALAHAASIAERAGAQLRLVLVHTPLPVTVAEVSAVPLMNDMDHREREDAYLQEQAAWLRDRGLTVATELREGDVTKELKDAATSADLVVLATHGRGGIERAWLGSVADSLVRSVATPLLLIRPIDEEGEPRRSVAAPTHILVGVGGSPGGEAAVEEAAKLARTFGARMTLLRVVAFPSGLASPYLHHGIEMDRAAAEADEEQAREALRKLAARHDDIEIGTRLSQAYHAARGILDTAAEVGADMVAVAAHRRSVVERAVLGSTADKVVRASDVPVLVARSSTEE